MYLSNSAVNNFQPHLQVTIAHQTFVYAKVMVIAVEEDILIAI